MGRSGGIICLLMHGDYKVGDPAPEGYVVWHEWAQVQQDGGLRTTKAPCGHWLFPQELKPHRRQHLLERSHG